MSAFWHDVYVGFERIAGFEPSVLNFALIFAGLFLVCFIFGAPLTYDARAEEEGPR